MKKAPGLGGAGSPEYDPPDGEEGRIRGSIAVAAGDLVFGQGFALGGEIGDFAQFGHVIRRLERARSQRMLQLAHLFALRAAVPNYPQ